MTAVLTGPAYRAPLELAEALALLADRPEGVRVVGGGTLVYPQLAEEAVGPRLLLDVTRLPGFDAVERDGDVVRVGPAATYTGVLAAGAGAHPLLRKQAAGITGGPQIRNQGTVGGSACWANPSSDVPTGLLAAEAVLTLAGHGGERTVPAAGFFLGACTTALRPGELLTGISITAGAPADRWGYAKLKRSEGSWPIVVAAARVRGASVSVTVGAATAVPWTVSVSVPDDFGRGERQALAELVVTTGVDWWDDELADAAYRRRVAGVVAVRAVEDALTHLGEGSA